MPHKLSVGAIFKNEAHGMREWVRHYLFHGADHIYLIDDGSTDMYQEQIQEFIDKNQITLFKTGGWDYYLGRQRDMYNTFILPRLKESEWWLLCDLDEYVYCPEYIDLKVWLYQLPNIGQIQIENMYFGSNGHITQPKEIVNAFTKRKEEISRGHTKYFLQSTFEFSSLNIHHATFVNPEEDKNNFYYLTQQYYIVNHYSCQSKELWNTVKCTRGDGDHYRVRTPDDFYNYDFNEVEDLRLMEQNAGILS